MQTERLSLAVDCRENSLKRAAELLIGGGIVAIPTETVYGLAARADNDDAITRVFAAKGRPQDNPLIVHIADFEMIHTVASSVPEAAKECAERFWPGPLTMVLERTDAVADSVCAGLSTVAVRMPSDPVAREIIRLAGPLAAPSANTSGRPSPTTARHVLDDLDGKIDAVVLSGDCGVGVESTVVTLATDPPRLLRPGAVTPEQLREVLPGLVVDPAVLREPEKNARVASPGMKYKHYAPATETYLVEGSSEAFAEYVNRQEDCLAVCFAEDAPLITGDKLVYGSGLAEDTLAQHVFDALREVDFCKKRRAYVHSPSREGIGLAVYNRLIRAAAFRVITL